MIFTPSILYNHLTIVLVGHNLVKLHYPFIEAFWSALPLGCRFLIGNFESTDRSHDYFEILNQYAPVTIIDGPWRADTGGTAIGIATQHLLDHSPTDFVYNLQACEVLADDFPQTVFNLFTKEMVAGVDPGPKPANQLDNGVPTFCHIWGSFNFEGSRHGAAYNMAQRLMRRTARIDQNDGCNPEPAGGFPLGLVYRYAYCFPNQIKQKVPNHIHLYRHGEHQIAQQFSSIEWCRTHPNYHGPHPSYVQHLRDNVDYNVDHSLDVFRQAVTKKS